MIRYSHIAITSFIFTLLFINYSTAQQYPQNTFLIEGKVTDKSTGNPLSQTNILILGTLIGTSTNEQGEYQINIAPGEYEMLIRYVGYRTLKEKISISDKNIERNLKLERDLIEMTELVIVGTRSSDRTLIESPVPLDIIQHKEIEIGGLTETNQIIEMLVPSFNFPFCSIPTELVKLVSQFKDSHWECIKAITIIGKDLMSLIKTNPALAYVVVNMDKINKSYICYTNLEILQRMIRTKQRDILKLAGFPEAERMVNIFAKMDTHSITIKEIITLKNILSIRDETTEEILKLFSFTKRINKRLIVLINENYMLLSRMTHKLIFNVVNSDVFNEHIKFLAEIRYYLRRLNILIPKLSSLSSIIRLKMNLKEEWTEKKKEKVFFPDPPIQDNCFVQAICSENELRDWGRKQHNCVADYSKHVHEGGSYIYKVFHFNEEATLSLILNGNKVKKGSLLGPCNSEVTSGLKKVVNEWLKENRIKKND